MSLRVLTMRELHLFMSTGHFVLFLELKSTLEELKYANLNSFALKN